MDHDSPEGAEVHAIFAALRDGAAAVVTDVAARVQERIEELRDSQRGAAPPPDAVAGGIFTHGINLLAHLLGHTPEGRQDD